MLQVKLRFSFYQILQIIESFDRNVVFKEILNKLKKIQVPPYNIKNIFQATYNIPFTIVGVV